VVVDKVISGMISVAF